MTNRIDITDGISAEISVALNKTVEGDNEKGFYSLVLFIRKVLRLSTDNLSIDHFSQYVDFFPGIYRLLHKAQDKSWVQQYFNNNEFASDQLSNIISDIVFKWKDDAKELALREKIVPFYKVAFTSFSMLFYHIIRNSDLNGFYLAIRNFEEINGDPREHSASLRFDLQDLMDNNVDGQLDGQIEEKKREFYVSNAFSKFKRHVLIGTKYWIYHLFVYREMNFELAQKLLEPLRIYYFDGNDMIRDILEFRRHHILNYLDWERFSAPSTEPGNQKEYTDPIGWLTAGFFLDHAKEADLFFNPQNLSRQDIEETLELYKQLSAYKKSFLKKYEERPDEFNKIFSSDSIEIFTRKLDDLIGRLSKVHENYAIEKYNAIAQAVLAPDKVKQLRERLSGSWLKESRMRKLFNKYGNIARAEGDQPRVIGSQNMVANFKEALINGENFREAPTLGDLGGDVGRMEDDRFFAAIVQREHEPLTDLSYDEVLQKSILALGEAGHIAKLIVIHQNSRMAKEQLLENKDFMDKRDEVDLDPDEVNFYLGRFKNIPVYTTWSSRMANKVLVCDFDNAFEMQIPQNDEGGPLHFVIDNITKVDAANLLKKDPLKYGRKHDGSRLSENEALARTSAMLKIGLWTKAAFNVRNNKAYLLTRIVPRDTILPEQKIR